MSGAQRIYPCCDNPDCDLCNGTGIHECDGNCPTCKMIENVCNQQEQASDERDQDPAT